MSLEAIEQITAVEEKVRADRTAADSQAQQIKAEAERNGQARLTQVRTAAAEEGRTLFKQAEDRAAQRAVEIERTAQAEADALRKQAEQHLEEAAEFIVGRVVNT